MTVEVPAPNAGVRVTVGVDLGGTGMRLVALAGDGAVHNELTLPTPHAGPSTTVISELIAHIRTVTADDHLAGIGIGASGPVDADGIIRNPDTLPGFTGIPIATLLSEALGVRCVIDNDTVAGAVGENTYGAGRQSPALLMITLGTGVGACLLTAAGPLRGGDGIHPEAGHLPVTGPPAPCYCGLLTCWEQLASRRALDRLTHNKTSDLAAAAHGDSRARAVFEEYGRRVGIGTSALVTLFRPQHIVFGGSAARYLPLFSSGLDQALVRSGPFTLTPTYAEAELGALSGAIGAAVLATKPNSGRCP